MIDCRHGCASPLNGPAARSAIGAMGPARGRLVCPKAPPQRSGALDGPAHEVPPVSSAPTVLTATRRAELGKGAARVRRAGRVPAVVFGHGLESMPVSLDAHEFDVLRKHLHSNTLIELRVEGAETRTVMVHGIHID